MHSKFNDQAASQHAHNTNVSSGGLVKATLGAAAVAAAILTFIWLPAEYGIDPTGAGHALGLTQMGEIKEQLHAEAEADAAAEANTAVVANANTNAAVANTLTADSAAEINNKLIVIQSQLAAITAKLDATPAAGFKSSSTVSPLSTAATVTLGPTVEKAERRSLPWVDKYTHTLSPGEGIEVKLKMLEGAVADFEWTANGAVLNYDTHGDGNGQKVSYEKGRGVPEQSGTLIAAFTGNHGWFWRNRTDDDVEVTLRTRGDYSELVLPK